MGSLYGIQGIRADKIFHVCHNLYKELICGLLPAHKRQKRAALYQRETDRNQENDNLEESLKNLEAENTGEDSLSYQLLRLDLERDLLRERRKLRKSEKSTAAGLEILYAILKGVSGAEIMETMEIPESSYYRCVKKARKHLWQVAMA